MFLIMTAFGNFSFRSIQCTDGLSITENSHFIRNGDDFFQLVRNHNASNSLIFKLTQQLQRFSLSSSFSAAVGSSRISSLTSLLNALAISTSCCFPTPKSLINVSGFTFNLPFQHFLGLAQWFGSSQRTHHFLFHYLQKYFHKL